MEACHDERHFLDRLLRVKIPVEVIPHTQRRKRVMGHDITHHIIQGVEHLHLLSHFAHQTHEVFRVSKKPLKEIMERPHDIGYGLRVLPMMGFKTKIAVDIRESLVHSAISKSASAETDRGGGRRAIVMTRGNSQKNAHDTVANGMKLTPNEQRYSRWEISVQIGGLYDQLKVSESEENQDRLHYLIGRADQRQKEREAGGKRKQSILDGPQNLTLGGSFDEYDNTSPGKGKSGGRGTPLHPDRQSGTPGATAEGDSGSDSGSDSDSDSDSDNGSDSNGEAANENEVEADQEESAAAERGGVVEEEDLDSDEEEALRLQRLKEEESSSEEELGDGPKDADTLMKTKKGRKIMEKMNKSLGRTEAAKLRLLRERRKAANVDEILGKFLRHPVTLLDTLTEARRVTWVNAARWAYELALTVHHSHCRYQVVGPFGIEDVVLIPDLAVCSVCRSVLQRTHTQFQDPMKHEFILKAGSQEDKAMYAKHMRRLRRSSRVRNAWLSPIGLLTRFLPSSDGDGERDRLSPARSRSASPSSPLRRGKESTSHSPSPTYKKPHGPHETSKDANAQAQAKAHSRPTGHYPQEFKRLRDKDQGFTGKCLKENAASNKHAAERQMTEYKMFLAQAEQDMHSLGFCILSLLCRRPLAEWERKRCYEHLSDETSVFDNICQYYDTGAWLGAGDAAARMVDLLEVCLGSRGPMQPLLTSKMKKEKTLRFLELPFTAGSVSQMQKLLKIVLAEAKAKRWKKKRHLTNQDLRFIEANNELHTRVMQLRAESGQTMAKRRNQAHHNKTIFDMLSEEEQQRVLRRRHARKITERNRINRVHWMHAASFHNWSQEEVRRWCYDAITSHLREAWVIRRPTVANRLIHLNLQESAIVKLALGPIEADNRGLIRRLLPYHGMKCNLQDAQLRGTKLSNFELDADMDMSFKLLAKDVVYIITDLADAMTLVSFFDEAQEMTQLVIDKNNFASLLSPLELNAKRQSLDIDFFVRCFEALPVAVGAWADDTGYFRKDVGADDADVGTLIEYNDKRQQWLTSLIRMLARCLIKRYDEEKWLRDRGISIAAERLVAEFRRTKVMKAMNRVWRRILEVHGEIIDEQTEKEEREKSDRMARMLKGEASDDDQSDDGAAVSAVEGTSAIQNLNPRLAMKYSRFLRLNLSKGPPAPVTNLVRPPSITPNGSFLSASPSLSKFGDADRSGNSSMIRPPSRHNMPQNLAIEAIAEDLSEAKAAGGGVSSEMDGEDKDNQASEPSSSPASMTSVSQLDNSPSRPSTSPQKGGRVSPALSYESATNIVVEPEEFTARRAKLGMLSSTALDLSLSVEVPKSVLDALKKKSKKCSKIMSNVRAKLAEAAAIARTTEQQRRREERLQREEQERIDLETKSKKAKGRWKLAQKSSVSAFKAVRGVEEASAEDVSTRVSDDGGDDTSVGQADAAGDRDRGDAASTGRASPGFDSDDGANRSGGSPGGGDGADKPTKGRKWGLMRGLLKTGSLGGVKEDPDQAASTGADADAGSRTETAGKDADLDPAAMALKLAQEEEARLQAIEDEKKAKLAEAERIAAAQRAAEEAEIESLASGDSDFMQLAAVAALVMPPADDVGYHIVHTASTGLSESKKEMNAQGFVAQSTPLQSPHHPSVLFHGEVVVILMSKGDMQAQDPILRATISGILHECLEKAHSARDHLFTSLQAVNGLPHKTSHAFHRSHSESPSVGGTPYTVPLSASALPRASRPEHLDIELISTDFPVPLGKKRTPQSDAEGHSRTAAVSGGGSAFGSPVGQLAGRDGEDADVSTQEASRVSTPDLAVDEPHVSGGRLTHSPGALVDEDEELRRLDPHNVRSSVFLSAKCDSVIRSGLENYQIRIAGLEPDKQYRVRFFLNHQYSGDGIIPKPLTAPFDPSTLEHSPGASRRSRDRNVRAAAGEGADRGSFGALFAASSVKVSTKITVESGIVSIREPDTGRARSLFSPPDSRNYSRKRVGKYNVLPMMSMPVLPRFLPLHILGGNYAYYRYGAGLGVGLFDLTSSASGGVKNISSPGSAPGSRPGTSTSTASQRSRPATATAIGGTVVAGSGNIVREGLDDKYTSPCGGTMVNLQASLVLGGTSYVVSRTVSAFPPPPTLILDACRAKVYDAVEGDESLEKDGDGEDAEEDEEEDEDGETFSVGSGGGLSVASAMRRKEYVRSRKAVVRLFSEFSPSRHAKAPPLSASNLMSAPTQAAQEQSGSGAARIAACQTEGTFVLRLRLLPTFDQRRIRPPPCPINPYLAEVDRLREEVRIAERDKESCLHARKAALHKVAADADKLAKWWYADDLVPHSYHIERRLRVVRHSGGNGNRNLPCVEEKAKDVVRLGKWRSVQVVRARSMQPTVEGLQDTASRFDKSGLATGDGSRATRAKLANVSIRPITIRDHVRAMEIRELVADLSTASPRASSSAGAARGLETTGSGKASGDYDEIAGLVDQHIQLLSFGPNAPSAYPDRYFPSAPDPSAPTRGDNYGVKQNQAQHQDLFYPRPHYAVQVTYRVTALNRHGAGRPGPLFDGKSSTRDMIPPSPEHTLSGSGCNWRTMAVFLRNEDMTPAHLLSQDNLTASLNSREAHIEHEVAEVDMKPPSAPSLAVRSHPSAELFPPGIHDRSPVYMAEKQRLEEKVDELTTEQVWLDALAGPPERQLPSVFATGKTRDSVGSSAASMSQQSVGDSKSKNILPVFREVKGGTANLQRELDELLVLEEKLARLDSLGRSET